MGMQHNSDVSDATFFRNVEEPFALRRDVQQRYDILFYGRVRDDGLGIMGGDAHSRRSFWAEFKRRSVEFKIKLDSISSSSVQMLDLEFFKGPIWRLSGRMDSRLFVKQTSVWKPLSVDSAHHVSVHMARPRGMVGRLFRRFSAISEARAYVRQFVARYKRVQCVEFGEINVAKSSGPFRDGKPSWLVVPYRHEGGDISNALRSVQFPKALASRVDQQLARVAWSSGSKHLVHVIRFKSV